MTDGFCRRTGVLASVNTGNPVGFTDFGQFEEAVKTQINHAVKAVVKGSHVIDEICMDRFVPALSLSFKDCIKNCLDYARGGAKYNTGNGIILIGVADIINSMAAVKELVYDKKLVSMKDLISALDHNFVGYEDIHMLCTEAPKYGNDDELTNEIAGEMLSYIADEIEGYQSKFGKMTPGILPVSGNTPFGLVVGALPSGRKAWKPLADGLSPSGGTDINGVSAVLKSVASIPHERFVQGTLLNMKLEPDMLQSENGINQLMALLKSMCSLGVFHAQFNIIDKEMLIAAQDRPEEHKGLLIRVAGYTAYFTELGRDVQDEIIGRTLHSNI
jgi:formate C-acetyltransferase